MEIAQAGKPEEKDEAAKLVERFKWLQRRSPYRSLRVLFPSEEEARRGWIALHSKTGVDAVQAHRVVTAKCHPMFALEMAKAAVATGGECSVPDEVPRPAYPSRTTGARRTSRGIASPASSRSGPLPHRLPWPRFRGWRGGRRSVRSGPP